MTLAFAEQTSVPVHLEDLKWLWFVKYWNALQWVCGWQIRTDGY